MRKLASILLVVFLLLPACKRIPLYDPATDVYLKLDVQLNLAVQVSTDIDLDLHPELKEKVIGKMPETVRACFYDPETHKLVSEDYLPSEGGFINLPPGVYDMIIYSLGTENTQIGGTETRAGAYAYTSQTGSKVKVKNVSKGDGDDQQDTSPFDPQPTISEYPVIYEPDHIFVARQQIEVPVHSATEFQTIIIESEAQSVVQTYSLEVKNVVGAGNIQKADVYVTGQIPSRYLWDLHYPNSACAIYFPSVIDEEKGHLFTVFNTFGKYPGMSAEVYLNVLVTTEDGGKYQWVFDVTDQFDNPDNTTHEIIIDEQVDVPDPGTGGGGFNPTVNEWGTEIIEVPVS